MPWWGLLTSVGAPVTLVGGWALAAHWQPGGFDEVSRTISELAASGTPHRWVMTVALLATGLCQVGTAAALRPAATPGRMVLACGGAATILVALLPLPESGGSLLHAIAATAAFVSLAVWPWWGRSAAPGAPWGLRTPVALVAGAVMLGLVLWFFVVAVTGGPRVGRAERIAAGVQAGWPFVVVLSARWAWRRAAISPGP